MRRRSIATVILAGLLASGCVRIDSGGAGVLWSALSGGTQEEVFKEGLHIVAPWNRMFIYDVRVHERLEKTQILTSNGLQVQIEVSIRFTPSVADLPKLQQSIGPAYFEKIVQPVLRSEVRNIIGQYKPEEIYSTKRAEIETKTFDAVKAGIEDKYILLDAIMFRNIVLPEKLKRSIEDKLEEEQRAEKMKYTLERERQEADRKRIEAQGIADFQKIVSKGISPELLRWKGIEATQELATSQNAKVVVIGAGESGLPLILGGRD